MNEPLPGPSGVHWALAADLCSVLCLFLLTTVFTFQLLALKVLHISQIPNDKLEFFSRSISDTGREPSKDATQQAEPPLLVLWTPAPHSLMNNESDVGF